MNLNYLMAKNEIIPQSNSDLPRHWPIGIDLGTSGIKAFAPNKIFCFQNYAKKLTENEMIELSDKDILLCDGLDTWLIGYQGLDFFNTLDAKLSDNRVYWKEAFPYQNFRVVVKAALGICLLSNDFREYKGEQIIIHAGIPPAYLRMGPAYTDRIMQVMAGDHDFELKIGTGSFDHLKFHVDERNIAFVIQPYGALLSALIPNDCTAIPDDLPIIDTVTLVLDSGFSSVDTLYFTNTGMKADEYRLRGLIDKFHKVARTVTKRNNICKDLLDMKKELMGVHLWEVDHHKYRKSNREFDSLPGMNTEDVFKSVVDHLMRLTNFMEDYKFLIISGGTGDALLSSIRNRFEIPPGLTVLSANRHDTSISNVYSNVRGIYLSMVSHLIRELQ